MIRAATIAFLFVIGCSKHQFAPGTVSRGEYDIYTQIADSLSSSVGYIHLILRDSTIQRHSFDQSQTGFMDDAIKRMAIMWPDLVVDELAESFTQTNARRFLLAPGAFKTKLPVQSWDRKQDAAFFKSDVQKEAVILSFSRVAFDENRGTALVYFEFHCGGLCGAGNWCWLSREGAGYRIVQILETWVS